MKAFLKGSLLGKIVATIFAFVWILNLIPSWYSTDLLFDNKVLRIALFIIFVIFWIPATIVSIWWIWISKD